MNYYLNKLKGMLGSIFYVFISLFVKRDENCIAIGSWTGELYIDNSRYLAEYIVSHAPDRTVYWIGKEELRDALEKENPGLTFLTKDKFFTNLKLLRCKYFFFSQKHDVDISEYNVYRGAITCYLHHGTPVKRFGDDRFTARHSPLIPLIKRLGCTAIEYSYFPVSSSLHQTIYMTAMRSFGFSPSRAIRAGTPRNDMLVNYDPAFANKCKCKYSDKLHFANNARIIMYLPTYRRISQDIFSFATLSGEQLSEMVDILEKHNLILIEKSHFGEKVEYDKPKLERILFAGKDVNVQEMLLFTDYLISDYSGAFLDFTLLDRPIIHFAYDYEYYRDTDSGLYYDINDFAAGEVVYNFDELCSVIREIIAGNDKFIDRRHYVRNKFMEYEQGHSCEAIFQTVIERGAAR